MVDITVVFDFPLKITKNREKVKKVTVGRIMREGCLYRIFREDLSRKFRVEKRERRNCGPNNRRMVMVKFRAISESEADII